MAQKTKQAPKGYKTTRSNELHEIVKFQDVGDSVEGRYMGVKILPSDYNKDGSVLWQIVKDDGELVLVNEKTVMKDIRISILKEGDQIMIVYNGEVQGKKRKYKDFEVFIKE